MNNIIEIESIEISKEGVNLKVLPRDIKSFQKHYGLHEYSGEVLYNEYYRYLQENRSIHHYVAWDMDTWYSKAIEEFENEGVL